MAAPKSENLVLGVVAVVNGVKGVLKDGKVDLNDLQPVLDAVPAVKLAVEGIKEVPAELAVISAEDVEALVAKLVAGLALGDAKLEGKIVAGVKVVHAAWNLVVALKS